jgi:hypothetical protein
MSNGPSRTLIESSNKNVMTMKLGSSRELVSLSKEVHPESKTKMNIILFVMRIRLFIQ